MMEYFGFAGQILYVDLTTGDSSKEPLDLDMAEKYFGGHGIAYKLAFDLIKPGVDPLSPDNPVIVSAGPLVGTSVPGCGKCGASLKFPTPAIMAIDVFFGVRPTAEGLEVLPSLPKGWNDISVENLRVRNSRVSVTVRRSSKLKKTEATVDGESVEVRGNRGVLIKWSDLPRKAAVVIIQPEHIPETDGYGSKSD